MMGGPDDSNETRAARIQAVAEALAEMRRHLSVTDDDKRDAPWFLGALASRGWSLDRA